MTRLAGLGLVLAAVGGYLIGRHRSRLRVALGRLRWQAPAPIRAWADVTEYEHEYGREAAHRHEIAEEIRRRPLRARRAESPDDAEGIASQPIRRERDDHPYPTST